MKFKMLLMFFSSLVLFGCVKFATVGTLAIATKISIDPRPIGTQIDDFIIKMQILNLLNKDTILKSRSRIVTTVYQGKILITGQIPCVSLFDHMLKTMDTINEDKHVFNYIRITKPISKWRMFKDYWTTLKIRLKLLNNDIAKSSNIKVITENSEVFVIGLVSKTESNLIYKIISKINGIVKVTTIFTYI